MMGSGISVAMALVGYVGFVWLIIYAGMRGFIRKRRANPWIALAIAAVFVGGSMAWSAAGENREMIILAALAVAALAIAFWPRRDL